MRKVMWLAGAGLMVVTAGCVEQSGYPTTYGYAPPAYGYSNNYSSNYNRPAAYYNPPPYSQPAFYSAPAYNPPAYRPPPVYYPPPQRVVSHSEFAPVQASPYRRYRDQDRDGIPDRYDRDKNGDGIPDRRQRRW